MQVRSTRYHLPAIFAAYAFHQGGCGTNDIRLRQAKPLDPLVQLFTQEQRLVLRAASILVAVGKLDELAERGIAIATAHIDLGLVKFMIVVARGGVNTKMLWVECLANHAPGLFTPPGPSGHLG